MLLALCFVAAASPAYVRDWTVMTGWTSELAGVRNGVIYYLGGKGVGAIDRKTGRHVWLKAGRYGAYGKSPYLTSRRMVVVSSGGEGVSAFDLGTGAERLLYKGQEIAEFTVNSELAVVLLKDGTVKAINVDTGKVAWSRSFPTKDSRYSSGLAAADGCVAVGLENSGLHVLDLATGKPLWNHKSDYASTIYMAEGIIRSSAQGFKAHETRTGKLIQTVEFYPYQYAQGIVIDVSDDETEFTGYSWRTMAKRWSIKDPPSTDSLGARARAYVTLEGTHFWIETMDSLRLVDVKGDVLWKTPHTEWRAQIVDEQGLIVEDGSRIMSYVPGELPAFSSDPETRQLIAKKLLSQYEELDIAERMRLGELSEYVAEPLLKKIEAWDKVGDESDDRMVVYDIAQELDGVLRGVLKPAHTVAALATLGRLKPEGSLYRALAGVMNETADPEKAIPFFIDRLRKGEKEHLWRELEVVSNSKSPQAVKFMLDALENPAAPPDWRRAAFEHLPSTAGQVGIDAIRKIRAEASKFRPWYERVDPEKLEKEQKLKVEKDDSGRTWMLFTSHILGNRSDLFIAEKTPQGWSRPVFLGFWKDNDLFLRPKEPPKHKDILVSEIVTSRWIEMFPKDAEIRKDTDVDTLTDLVEERYGTDPKKADTDSDGIRDHVDPCPDAAPREMGDREKIVAASIEAYFFARTVPPASIHVQNMEVDNIEPFQFAGYDAPVMWKRSGLALVYGGGANSISVGGRDVGIVISPDGKSAKTWLSRYSGGLDGEGVEVDLIKVGDEWFVTRHRVRIVS